MGKKFWLIFSLVLLIFVILIIIFYWYFNYYIVFYKSSPGDYSQSQIEKNKIEERSPETIKLEKPPFLKE